MRENESEFWKQHAFRTIRPIISFSPFVIQTRVELRFSEIRRGQFDPWNCVWPSQEKRPLVRWGLYSTREVCALSSKLFCVRYLFGCLLWNYDVIEIISMVYFEIIIYFYRIVWDLQGMILKCVPVLSRHFDNISLTSQLTFFFLSFVVVWMRTIASGIRKCS